MRINLYDILSVVGKEMTVEANMDCKQIDFQGEPIELICKEPFLVSLKHVRKGIVSLNCNAAITVKRACSRCLTEVVRDYDLKISRTMNVEKKEAVTDNLDEYDEISYIEDCNLDVDLLVLDELYTVLPMSVLCKEDCKGICKVCGTNLNKSICDCDQTVPDPRMAVFSDIFNQFKEV